MFSLTSRERKVLLIVAGMIFCGAIIRYFQVNIKSSTATLTSSTSYSADTIVNINKASQEELETIPGIGPAFAQRIIAYRVQNGDFQTLEDLKKVKGIGAKKLGQMKEYVSL
ncbi:MAG: ComEA family DNA-binding protein [Candidatus Omnitrophica bacterium]|nr:ComEA family DNA-binding protein [Candidatus Omnitrophota bacterium]